MATSYDAVLLIAFGGPGSSKEIRPFLARVTRGMSIPPQRLEEVARHYEAVGGKSPLNEITFRQAQALQNRLQDSDCDVPVYVGMRNASPFFAETLKQMADDGVKRALGLILSSHRTEASWERYQENIADARGQLGGTAPEVGYCNGWHDHPLFIEAWAELIEAALHQLDSAQRQQTRLVFTAHSLPAAMAARSPYVEQFAESARLIAAQLDRPHWSLAYQSRSGKPSDAWLEPDIGDEIRKLAKAGHNRVVVAPIGFVCDHVEVLYDLDVEAKRIAADLGVELIRVSCPNDQPTFIRMMTEVVRQSLS